MKNLKQIMDEKRVGVRELARLTGMSKNTISEHRNNEDSKPNLSTVEKIAKALNVSPKKFL